MFSLRTLVRPSVLAPTLTAAAAICGLAIWHARAAAPVSAGAPSIEIGSEASATGWSVRSASSEDAAPAAIEGHALTLALTDKTDGDDAEWGYHSFAHDPRFPAVSADGTVAVLFEDAEDFTGAPITTLVAWNKSGKRVARFAIGGNGWSGNEQKMLGAANTWLARSTWTTLEEKTSGGWDDDYTKQTLTLASGASLVFDADSGKLTHAGRTIRASFGAPGTSDLGSCGSITGVTHVYSTDRLLVLVPSMNLGGDSCFGTPLADVATAVALR
ncbi:MAG TPA: hypothetical protein VGM39_04215 [Kofleriaceae bacterium]|jgi:hypothetical protein